LLYLPFLVLRERPDRQVSPEARLSFRQSLVLTLNNYPFRVLTLAGVLFWIGGTYVLTVIPYIVTEICGLTKADVPYFYLPAVAVALVCYPLVNWLTSRIGKWRVFSSSMLASAVVLPGLMVISDRWPIPLAAQGVVWVMLQAAALSGVTMLPQAFAAEITDYDAQQTGQRREGAYYSAWVSLGQIINGLALATLPLLLLLGRSQNDPQGPLGVRLTGLIGGGLFLLAFIVFQRYPLKKGLEQPA
jgi:GPH family glycoside/pentoside/hexuronide:cation symporter